MAQNPPLSAQDIRTARIEKSNLRERDLAEQLGISEAQLMAAHVGHGVTRITADPDRLMTAAEKLGEVMALTRTPSCVHEKVGRYANYHSGEHASMVLNEEIDLRLFPRHWVHGFALDQQTEKGRRRALLVFDAAGDAVHKIHMREGSEHGAWEAVVADLALEAQNDTLQTEPREAPEPATSRPDRADDLRANWDKLTDTHQFLTMVHRLKMNRLGAYRIAGSPYVRPVAPQSLEALFTELSAKQVPVMIFVGNQGCIQIHSGPVTNIKMMGPWLNVLDPGFDMHLRSDHVAEVWEVRKPTRRGMAVSIEAFDAQGRIILQIFGVRKPQDRVAEFEAIADTLPEAAPEEVMS
ncbi:hemin-degrading factor [Citreicella sp. C3M06]|uniref:hemin-degrading factor n=1 Tax=Citreicella sp. C3M06 TaxID=2841564 RepID=UPI001C0A641B|nr:ChuX/HutX family heme-like substrate-binding protein [Citreicella sp. C3M06]MBU2961837.1 hemin-degrading factor [Citreicella sp. C3M06]